MIVLGSKIDTPTCEKLDTKSLKTGLFLFNLYQTPSVFRYALRWIISVYFVSNA